MYLVDALAVHLRLAQPVVEALVCLAALASTLLKSTLKSMRLRWRLLSSSIPAN